tara:strand:+ start:352 stop:495 length:144 start_codon:yes stop_codon:yes gene_type:complete
MGAILSAIFSFIVNFNALIWVIVLLAIFGLNFWTGLIIVCLLFATFG